jgi:hypothetical protein
VAVAIGACACGADPDVGDELGSTPGAGSEMLGSTEQAIIAVPAERSVAAAQLMIDGDLQEWVFACDTLGRLRHRVRYGNGSWGAWRNHNQACSGPPTVAVYTDAAGNELPIAYYRNDLMLRETTWSSSSSSSSVDINQYIGIEHIASDPVVSYYDKSNGDVSLLVTDYDQGRDLHSVDYYAGSWHRYVVSTWSVDRLQVFFSSATKPAAFLTMRTNNASVAYKRSSPDSPYTLVGTYSTVLGFGGLYQSCKWNGCLMSWDLTGMLKWGLMKSQPPAYTINMLSLLSSGPSMRAGGDPGQTYMVAGQSPDNRPTREVLGLHAYYTDQMVTAGNAPAIPTCEPSLVTNVYAGSRYEKDAFIAVGEGVNRLTHVYASGYLNPSLFTEDLGLDIKLSTN